jgi:hypothetical protein
VTAKIKSTFVNTSLDVKGFFALYRDKIKIQSDKLNREFASSIAKEARKVIQEQRYSWTPLSKRWLAEKRRKGYDLRIYIATKDYLHNGIGVWKDKDKLLHVGPRPDGIHKPSGLTYFQLGRILEFGVWDEEENRWKIPPRPMWKPLKRYVRKESKIFRKQYTRVINRSFNRAFKRYIKTKKRKTS